MWSLLPRKAQLTAIVATGVALAWSLDAAYAFVGGQPPSVWKCISFAVFIIGGVLTAVGDKCWRGLWRVAPFFASKVFPDLNGVWKGTLVSTWIDPETDQPKPPIPTEITIKQGLFSTSVSLKTGESKSYSTRCFLEPFYERRVYRIWYSYNNDPQAQLIHRSSPHEGVAFLELDFEKDPNHLVGRYYTARRTTGDLDVKRRKK